MGGPAGAAGTAGGTGAGGTANNDGGVVTEDAGLFACNGNTVIGHGDYDGDGVADCVVTSPTSQPSVFNLVFHKGLGGNTFSAAEVVTPKAVPAGYVPGSMGIDWNGDGRADLFFQLQDASPGVGFSCLRGHADGTFGPSSSEALLGSPDIQLNYSISGAGSGTSTAMETPIAS